MLPKGIPNLELGYNTSMWNWHRTSKRIGGLLVTTYNTSRTFFFLRVIGSRASISGHYLAPCAAPFQQIWPNGARTSGELANEWRRWSCSTALWHEAICRTSWLPSVIGCQSGNVLLCSSVFSGCFGGNIGTVSIHKYSIFGKCYIHCGRCLQAQLPTLSVNTEHACSILSPAKHF